MHTALSYDEGCGCAIIRVAQWVLYSRCKKNISARSNNLAKARLTQAQSLDEPGSSATPDHTVSNGVNISTDPVPTSAPRSPSGSNHSPVRSLIYLMKLNWHLLTSA